LELAEVIHGVTAPEVNPLNEKLWDTSEEFELITTIAKLLLEESL
jgi:hypothetical protein